MAGVKGNTPQASGTFALAKAFPVREYICDLFAYQLSICVCFELHLERTPTKTNLPAFGISNSHHISRAMDETDRKFTRAVDAFIARYDDNTLDLLAEGAEQLLEDFELLQDHRIEFLVMMASVIAGWQRSEAFRVRAENLW